MFPSLLLAAAQGDPEPLNASDLARAGKVIGIEFSDGELELMLADVIERLAGFEKLRAHPLENADAPALLFDPLAPGITGAQRAKPLPAAALELPTVSRPEDLSTLYYADIPTLAALVRSKQVSCVELAQTFLGRLEEIDASLACVIEYTPERALAQAAELDRELAAGKWRGPLHGIPWGAKDLLAVRGGPTTWGAKPYQDQVIDLDATVVERLDAAGAVLIAKLTLGALAWGDVWFGGKTKNPWNLEQGSSGSSAGSAAATAAGGVVFAIGSETLGSIVSPSARCGNSSLRPTFGRVSRHGAMTLCWSLDKLGPLCRSARDAALVFEAIHGPDGLDATVREMPFAWAGDVDVKDWKVGVLPEALAQERESGVLADLLRLGVQLVPVELPKFPVDEMMIVLQAEAACAFDELTRSGRDDLLVRQARRAWPNVFRHARLIPAVEYLRAQRLRAQLMRELDAALAGVDVLVHENYAADLLSITNLTGHPTFVAPAGFRENGTPTSISFTGHLFDEARVFALAHAWQTATDHHLRHPVLK